MSDEAVGAGQSGQPPKEDVSTRPPIQYTQVGGRQYIISSTLATSQSHNMPALAQITTGNVTHLINLSPVRNQATTLRPSLTNQSIVNALTKSPRTSNTNVRLQLFSSGSTDTIQQQQPRAPVKRSLSSTSPEKKDTYSVKLQRVMNHRNVRSKIVKEKYNEHLLECFFLECGGNILDLYQFAKRPRTQQFVNYLKENAIDPKEHVEDITAKVNVPPTPPAATAVSSLPGSTITTSTPVSTMVTTSHVSQTVATPSEVNSTPKLSVGNKTKTGGFTNSSGGGGGNQELIVERAKQEAYVVQRISDLQKEGLWSERRLPKVQETVRGKVHWDFLLEEMAWLATDFAQERKWKKAAAKKCARMVQKYFQDKALAAQKAEKAQEQNIRRLANFCAKEIKMFWSNVEKLVEYKLNTRLEEKRKKALDQHLSFIVDQTEKYSQLLAEGMNKPLEPAAPVVPISNASSRSESRVNSDEEFRPDSENSSDDEETIAQEEATNKEEESAEVAALQRESEMDFESFLNELPKDYLQNRDKIRLSDAESDMENESEIKESEKPSKNKDGDFVAHSSSDEDNEDTIQEQEDAEGQQDHKKELDDLEAENEMSIEELRKKYANLPPINEDTNMSASTDEFVPSMDEGSSSDEASSEDEKPLDSSEHDEEDEVGLKLLLDDDEMTVESQKDDEGEDKKTDNNDLINDAAAIAESIQPKGNTLSSTSVVTPVPFLLKLPLREYQHIGLDWLVTMFERKLNGILADEMGLGKTIQTIALLAHLACEKENWGPHLIIVPTSVMLNWEMECKKWCPAFKILTYYGSQKERKMKRTGWTKPNAFHICITSYKLVIQDHQSFRRKKWKYLILDEAQNIKNFKSQRWQLLLNFQTQQRLLLTGTPLQNNLMELWSLMHFLMPNVFQSHREFKEWFSNPVTGMIEGNSEYNESIIKRLHKVLRPFLLRRLKSEVEKQMPKKYEHIIMCRLSKRQRFLYDDYMSRAKTRETLASGNLLSVINVLMQLRKVCNHPNLFEVRPTISPFHCEGIVQHIPSLVYSLFEYNPLKHINLTAMNLNLLAMEIHLSAYQCYRMRQYQSPKRLIEEIGFSDVEEIPCPPPTRLSMQVRKIDSGNKELKTEPKEETVKATVQSITPVNTKMKFPAGSVQILPQGIVVSQAPTVQSTTTNVNLSSVLKPTDKITVPSGVARLVQTSMGKHILFTPSSVASTSNLNLPINPTVMTSDQRFVISPSVCNQPQVLTKAVVKVHLSSVPTTTSTTVTGSAPEFKIEDRNSHPAKTVTSKYIEKLYANKSNKRELDVRWLKNDENKKDNDIICARKNRLDLLARVNSKRCNSIPLYGKDFRDAVKITTNSKMTPWGDGFIYTERYSSNLNIDTANCLQELVCNPAKRIEEMTEIFNRFIVFVPSVHAPQPDLHVRKPIPSIYNRLRVEKLELSQKLLKPTTILHPIVSAMVTQFPDPRLIQYDCGKLQTLDHLLRKLKHESHRVLIFTQMTKMLDVLEAFLNFHGHIYLRLDGTTKVDQRQMLMERFNGDKRIFAFILSTRSGGIGVNLTGADTVIFYDSDWNPTMDAQAQDRCHRIGQTRDVHIYRLISERTIEENILKKANQKRLLGDLAIEGGNFTTAYFKSSTIQDLFNIDNSEESATTRMSEVIECNREREKNHIESNSTSPTIPEDKAAIGALENALAACEDDQDVQAARTAKAEAVADLAEFDENIPLDDQEKDKEPEISKAEQEVENLIKQLRPIERYAMRFIEETEAAWSPEQLAAAEREIEEQKLEWERNRLAAMKEEEERRARELEEDNELLTFSREDAINQVWVSDNTMELMPMWCPPTPPQQDTDVYIDQTMAFLYDINVMSESQLPPVYVKKDNKRNRHESGLVDSRRPFKIHRKDDTMYAPPRSLFERPSPALMKMRRDHKLQKYRGIIRPPVPLPGVKLQPSKPTVEPPCFHNWTIYEDMTLLKVIQNFQMLPLNLSLINPGHTPNWDFVSDFVNTVSVTYRSPKQCRHRYESVIMPREEGKQNKSGRPLRTSQLYAQDNNATFSQIMTSRFDALKVNTTRRTTTSRSTSTSGTVKLHPKHAALLNDCGIDIDHPVLPGDVATRRAERLAREKKPQDQQNSQRLLKGVAGTVQTQTTPSQAGSSNSTQQTVVSTVSHVVTQTTSNVVAVSTTTITPSTPPAQATIRTQRIVASPLQTTAGVPVASLNATQLQQTTQRLIVSGTPVQAKAIVSGTAAGKTITPAQQQIIRQAMLKQQLRLQTGGLTAAQAVKTTTVTIAGQPAVQVQFTQAQPRAQVSYVKQGTAGINKQAIARVADSEVTQLLKQRQLHQKVLTASSQPSSIQSITPQSFVQTIQQAGSSGTQVATLVKAVSSTGVTQTVTIPVTGVTLGQVKALAPGATIKTSTPQQIRHIQFQQQMLAQKKIFNQKIGIAQVTGKPGVSTQLIVGSKPLTGPLNMQQFQQVIKTPLTVQQTPVVLAKGTPRVIPVNTGQGNKPTIQVVAATSQGITTTIRPQGSSTLAGALAGLKVPSNVTSPTHLLSQVTAALQNQSVVRQGSPVRIQTSSGSGINTNSPIVTVSMQSGVTVNQTVSSPQSNTEKDREQVSNRLLKK
ncbi:helicase domino isoform X2 [Onthophagus taurus]|uniref:helicase domino isoform X2 n=1 Tax=Onthophagus taurus TaxID=166361 RepID=UPI0039BDA5BF